MQPISRVLLAIGLSALAHLSLIFGFTLNLPGSGQGVVQVLHARMQPGDPPSEPSSQSKPRDETSRAATTPRMEPAVPAPEEPAAGQALALASFAQVPVEAAAEPVPLLAEVAIYTPRELDVFPKPLGAVTPPFPPRASEDRVSGAVTLELIIGQDGTVGEARVLEANPEGYFEESALESFKAARFSPGQKDGVPVRCRLAIKVDFEFDPSASASAER